MSKTVQQNVCVHTDDGDVWYGPGQTLAPEHEKLVTNESVFTEEDAPATRPVPGFGQTVYVDPEGNGDTGDGPLADRKVDQLRNLAGVHGVDLEGARLKEDIVARLNEAGVTDGSNDG